LKKLLNLSFVLFSVMITNSKFRSKYSSKIKQNFLNSNFLFQKINIFIFRYSLNLHCIHIFYNCRLLSLGTIVEISINANYFIDSCLCFLLRWYHCFSTRIFNAILFSFKTRWSESKVKRFTFKQKIKPKPNLNVCQIIDCWTQPNMCSNIKFK
jgi:hypothetical protein